MTGGQKKAFTAAQAADLSDRLINETKQSNVKTRQIRNAALFRVGICSMLRVSDLLNLKLSDVWDHKYGIQQEFTIIQKKTKDPVTCYLSDTTVKILYQWLHYRFSDDLYIDLFVKKNNPKIFELSDRQYRNIVQSWAKKIGLDATLYSSHSMRRTKPKEIYAQTRNIKGLKILLGHRHINTTALYLGVEQDEVKELARKIVI